MVQLYDTVDAKIDKWLSTDFWYVTCKRWRQYLLPLTLVSLIVCVTQSSMVFLRNFLWNLLSPPLVLSPLRHAALYHSDVTARIPLHLAPHPVRPPLFLTYKPMFKYWRDTFNATFLLQQPSVHPLVHISNAKHCTYCEFARVEPSGYFSSAIL